MPNLFRHIGLRPFVFPKATYDTVGVALDFRDLNSHTPLWSAHITVFVYSGTALISLEGDPNGNMIELSAGQPFDFPVESRAVYVKSAAGVTEVAVVAAINPLTKR